MKAGDRVLFGKWSGTEVKLDGEELLIMKESDIMGIVEADALPPQRPPKSVKVFWFFSSEKNVLSFCWRLSYGS